MGSLPKVGAHALNARGNAVQQAEHKGKQAVLLPASKDYAALASDAAEHQVRCCTVAKALHWWVATMQQAAVMSGAAGVAYSPRA